MPKPTKSISTILKETRGTEMSQEVAARIIGTQQPTLSKWETGTQSPSVEFLTGLAKFTGMEEMELLQLIKAETAKRGPQARKALALQMLAEAQRLLSDD